MSRCTIPLSWACCNARKICVVKYRASFQVMAPCFCIYSFKVMPSTYSITMYWSLSPKLTSYTFTILGWDITAMALDSFLNRRTKSSFCKNSSFRIFTATMRSSTLS